jgi:hypothetical protein
MDLTTVRQVPNLAISERVGVGEKHHASNPGAPS